ncbi:putative nuclease HARBI1 [Uranotaenia lowii]|uniref:putative nuclease HARBI1 n=1 Tax=Uranotaenia lowii TaxID=190385 RepID=UPI00247A2EDF|nr:putative nuclease HARBI1 [Uranotaenia lowii]
MSFVVWLYDDIEEDLPTVRLERRLIRDRANPLQMPDHMFTRYFRVSKALFHHLLKFVEASLGYAVGSASVSPVIKLSATLRFLAEGSYQKGTGNDVFVGMAQSTFSKMLSQVLDVLEPGICRNAIQFPKEDTEKNAIKLGFFQKTGFPGVIGCVDGTHIKIIKPSPDIQHLYYNRKGYHSLNVMIVCDHEMIIRYVDANNPGSNHDSFIWNSNPLDDHLKSALQRGCRNTWLLGDAGYPLKPYLITPFRVPSSSNVSRFNEVHSKTRLIVERSIGQLKNVFRCLLGARQLHYKPSKATQIVNVCCALHNLRIKYNVVQDIDQTSQEPENEEEFIDSSNDSTAEGVREEIMNSMFSLSN